jgi:hypothetical protein
MRLLVFADSLAFYGPAGPLPADDPRLWPNLLAERAGGGVELFARVGWTARDAYWSLTSDPRVWAELPAVDAVVLAVGSMDTLPSPLPTYLREGIRYLRPDAVRRGARAGYLVAQPALARAFGGRPVALPARLTVHYLDRIVTGLRSLRPGLPAVAVLPATHRARSYAFVHSGRPRAARAISTWARAAGVPTVDLPVLLEHRGDDNPDGMHWGWVTHRRVAEAFESVLAGDRGPR